MTPGSKSLLCGYVYTLVEARITVQYATQLRAKLILVPGAPVQTPCVSSSKRVYCAKPEGYPNGKPDYLHFSSFRFYSIIYSKMTLKIIVITCGLQLSARQVLQPKHFAYSMKHRQHLIDLVVFYTTDMVDCRMLCVPENGQKSCQ